MNDGIMHPRVHITAPPTPESLVPTNVAEFMDMGPGVISAIVIRSVNSLIVIRPCILTIWSCIRGIAA